MPTVNYTGYLRGFGIYSGFQAGPNYAGIDQWGKSALVKTPEWKLRKTRPHIFVPPTPFSAFQHFNRIGNLYDAHIQVGSGVVGTPNTNGEGSFCPDRNVAANFPDLRSTAITRCLKKLKDQKANYAQAFAERRQTARLVGDTANKFAKGITQLRRGNVKGFANALGFTTKKKFKGVQESWLELQYGWLPLLSDVNGAMEDLAKINVELPYRYVITVRASSARVSDTFRAGVSDPSMNSRHRADIREKFEESEYVILHYAEDNPALASAAATGFLNPALLAWELLPWSFVADWFIPIGNYLATLDAAVGYKFLGGCSTARYLYDLSVSRIYSLDYSPSQYRAGPHTRYRKGIERRIFSSSPLPRHPGFKNPFSLTHAANAIALLRARTVR